MKKRFSYLQITHWKNLKDEVKNFDIIINATSLGLKNGDDFDFNFSSTKEKSQKDEPVRLALIRLMHAAVEIINKKITKQLHRILGNFEDPRVVHGIRACRDHLSTVGGVPDKKSLEIFSLNSSP